jgi:hypothetical protein
MLNKTQPLPILFFLTIFLISGCDSINNLLKEYNISFGDDKTSESENIILSEDQLFADLEAKYIKDFAPEKHIICDSFKAFVNKQEACKEDPSIQEELTYTQKNIIGINLSGYLQDYNQEFLFSTMGKGDKKGAVPPTIENLEEKKSLFVVNSDLFTIDSENPNRPVSIVSYEGVEIPLQTKLLLPKQVSFLNNICRFLTSKTRICTGDVYFRFVEDKNGSDTLEMVGVELKPISEETIFASL